jgi:YD repeat-containing protein
VASLTRFTYNNAGQVERQEKREGTNGTGALQQDLLFAYDSNGRLVRYRGHHGASITTYAYDKAGNKVAERFEQRGVVYQDNHMSYDILGRLTQVVDARHHMDIKYDRVGNRRAIEGHYYDDSGPRRT